MRLHTTTYSTMGSNQSVPLRDGKLVTDDFALLESISYGCGDLATCMDYSHSGHLAVGTAHGVMVFGQPGVMRRLPRQTDELPIDVFFTSSGCLVTVSPSDLVVWDLASCSIRHRVHLAVALSCKITCAYSWRCYAHRFVFCGTDTGVVAVVDLQHSQLSPYKIEEEAGKDRCVIDMSSNPVEDNYMLILYDSGVVVLWDLPEATCKRTFQTTSGCRCISWAPDGTMFAAGYHDGQVQVWGRKETETALASFYVRPDKADRAPVTRIAWQQPTQQERARGMVNGPLQLGGGSTLLPGVWETAHSAEPFWISKSDPVLRYVTPGVTGRAAQFLSVSFPRREPPKILNLPKFESTSALSCSEAECRCTFVLSTSSTVSVSLLSIPTTPTFNLNPLGGKVPPSVFLFRNSHVSGDALSPEQLARQLYQCGGLSQSFVSCVTEGVWPMYGGSFSPASATGPGLLVTGDKTGIVRFWWLFNNMACAVPLHEIDAWSFFRVSESQSDLESKHLPEEALITALDLQMTNPPLLLCGFASGNVCILRLSSSAQQSAVQAPPPPPEEKRHVELVEAAILDRPSLEQDDDAINGPIPVSSSPSEPSIAKDSKPQDSFSQTEQVPGASADSGVEDQQQAAQSTDAVSADDLQTAPRTPASESKASPNSADANPGPTWKLFAVVAHTSALRCWAWLPTSRIVLADEGGFLGIVDSNSGECVSFAELSLNTPSVSSGVCVTCVASGPAAVSASATVHLTYLGLSDGSLLVQSGARMLTPKPVLLDQKIAAQVLQQTGRQGKSAGRLSSISFIASLDSQGVPLAGKHLSRTEDQQFSSCLLIVMGKQIHIVLAPTPGDKINELVSLACNVHGSPIVRSWLVQHPSSEMALAVVDTDFNLAVYSLMDLRLVYRVHLSAVTGIPKSHIDARRRMMICWDGSGCLSTPLGQFTFFSLFTASSPVLDLSVRSVPKAPTQPAHKSKSIIGSLFGSSPVDLSALLSAEAKVDVEQTPSSSSLSNARSGPATKNPPSLDKTAKLAANTMSAKSVMADNVNKARQNLDKAKQVEDASERLRDRGDEMFQLARALKQKQKNSWF